MGYQVTLTQQDSMVINIRADATALTRLTEHIQTEHGVSLPLDTGRATHTPDTQIVCVSPDHWLFVSKNVDQEQQFADGIQQALDAWHANATIVSGQYACFLIAGRDVREVLCQGCSINLDPDSFHHGHAALCALNKSKIALIPQTMADQYLVMIESSLADYFEQWVESASGLKPVR